MIKIFSNPPNFLQLRPLFTATQARAFSTQTVRIHVNQIDQIQTDRIQGVYEEKMEQSNILNADQYFDSQREFFEKMA